MAVSELKLVARQNRSFFPPLLRGSRSFCLVVQTRSDEWVGPIDRFLRQYGDWDKTVAKTADQAQATGLPRSHSIDDLQGSPCQFEGVHGNEILSQP